MQISNIGIHICIYPTPLHEQDGTQGQFLSGVLTGLNSVFLPFQGLI